MNQSTLAKDQNSRGQMITFVSPKGGTGKSTTAFALIGAIHEAEPDARIMVLDMDPQNTLADALEARSERVPDEEWYDIFALDGRVVLSAEQISKVCDTYSREYDYLVIDTQGAAKQEAVFFAASSDITMITSKYNEAELSPAVRFYKEVTRAMEQMGVMPSLYFLETRFSGLVQDLQAKAVRKQFDALGFPTLKTRIPHQLAFENVLSGGMFVHELAASAPNRSGYQTSHEACRHLWREVKGVINAQED